MTEFGYKIRLTRTIYLLRLLSQYFYALLFYTIVIGFVSKSAGRSNRKIRRVNFLYHDEGNSPVEFLISSHIDSALIRIPAAGTQRLDWMRVAERSPAVRAAFIFAAAVAVECAAIAAFV